MARRLPFLALSSSTLRRCSWRALLWPYAGATRTSKQGTPLKGKDALLWASVPLLTRIPSTEGYQCRSRQGYHPQWGISAATGKDTIHREVSVPPQARIPSTVRYQCRHRQGYHPQRGISAATGKDTIHREVSVPPQARIPSTERYQCCHRQGYHPQRCISAIISKDTIHRDVSVLSQARMLPQKHQCFPATTLEQGCSN